MKFIFILLLLISANCQQDLYECILLNLRESPIAPQIIEAIDTNNYMKLVSLIFSNPELAYLIIRCFGENPNKKLELLREKASNTIKSFFGIAYKFKAVPYEKEIVLYNLEIKITAKLVDSCTYTLYGDNSAFLKFENGVVIDKGGISLNINDPIVDKFKEFTGYDLKESSFTIENKFLHAINDGTISYKISPDKFEIIISYKSNKNKQLECEGSLILTISKGTMTIPDIEIDPVLQENLKKCGVIILIAAALIAIIVALGPAAIAALEASPLLYFLGLAAAR